MMDHYHRQNDNYYDYSYVGGAAQDSPNSTLWDLDSESLITPSYLRSQSEVYNQTAIQREVSYESGYSGDWTDDQHVTTEPQQAYEVLNWFPHQDLQSAESDGGCWEFPDVTFDPVHTYQQVVEQVAENKGKSGSTSSDESSHQVKLPSGNFKAVQQLLLCKTCKDMSTTCIANLTQLKENKRSFAFP